MDDRYLKYFIDDGLPFKIIIIILVLLMLKEKKEFYNFKNSNIFIISQILLIDLWVGVQNDIIVRLLNLNLFLLIYILSNNINIIYKQRILSLVAYLILALVTILAHTEI
jgi:hypothetical protein